MIRIALLAALVGCGPSDRERDCAEVRAIIAARPEGHYAKLRGLHYRDGTVRDAVFAATERGSKAPLILGTNVSAVDLQGPADRLRDLCHLLSRPMP
jgi:hypothetical protein